jgi:hypothetical protein
MPAFGANTALLGAAIVALVGLCLWRLRSVNLLMLRQRQQLQEAEAQQHRDASRLQSLQKELGAQRQQAVAASRDSACVRKKNHEQQALVKAIREELRDARRQQLEAQNSRPAFGAGGTRRAKGDPTRTAADGVSRTSLLQAPAAQNSAISDGPQAAVLSVSAEHVPATSDASQAAPSQAAAARPPEAALAAAQLSLAGLTEKLLLAQQAAAVAEIEVKKLRRRSEDLRRIDIINRSKQELLQDKLHTMGRRYYDAISEVAMLRGEVAPQPPAAEPTQSLFGGEDEAAAVASALRPTGKSLDN